MLTEFIKYWVGVTCAPESITSLELTTKAKTIVHKITNETKTKEVFVFEVLDNVIAITDTLDVKPEDVKSYNFNSASDVICSKLGLQSITI